MNVLDVLVKYGVGEKATATAWGDLCKFAMDMGYAYDVVMDELKKGEQEYKERTGEGLPSAYRSAKCVLKNAMELGVPVINDNNEPMGKTAVEKAIREARAVEVRDESMQDKMDVHIASMRKLFSTIDTEVEKNVMQHYLQEVMPSIWGY